MKKLRKNKFVVLAICVIIISIMYMCVQKIIDNYIFDTNSDIVSVEGEYIEEISNEQTVEFSEEEIDLEMEETEEEPSEDVIEKNEIYVYITGEVNNPGVVVLNEGSRIVDAINAAGGTTAKADVSKVNLVYVLDDGMKVNIPNNNDLENDSDFEYITMNSGDGRREEEATYAEGDSSEFSSGSLERYSVVNINTATQTELESLPGIGPSLALKIINYRKENGKFSSVEDIKNVSGIGDAKFNELKEYITV